jgi:hypothetical protein
MDEMTAWFAGRLPEDWFHGTPEVSTDREEVVVVGRLTAPEVEPASNDGGDEPASNAGGDHAAPNAGGGEVDAAQRAAEDGRIRRFREDTRRQRMQIAEEAQARFGRKVTWGASCGNTTRVFTSLSVPVMTRLRQGERQVLDTLVEAGVARSRSDALAWSVRLVGQHQREWIDELREALVAVEAARASGPTP